MKRSACWLLALSLPGLASAADKPIEASMVVTGTITVNPDGSVQRYTLYKQDELPPGVAHIVQRTMSHWEFLPVMSAGKPITAEAGMSLRIVAEMADVHAKQAILRVAGAEFGCAAGRARKLLPVECPADAGIGYLHRRPPLYPFAALRAGVGGEVFLVLEVGRDGRVMQAAARQVNLYSLTNQQEHYRKVLAAASMRAARNWQFKIPTTGPNAAKDHWVVQVPVNFRIGPPGTGRPAYGRWDAYVPGPVRDIPWDDHDAVGTSHGSADAIAGGSAPFMRDPRFVLKSPLATEGGHS